MELGNDLLYTKEHEWLLVEGNTVTIGITDFAQESLGDIVYVELPEVEMMIDAGDTLGNIESVKAVSELFAPISGEVIAINKDLEEEPELVNSSPYEGGWMVKVKVDAGELDQAEFLSDEAYLKLVESK